LAGIFPPAGGVLATVLGKGLMATSAIGTTVHRHNLSKQVAKEKGEDVKWTPSSIIATTGAAVTGLMGTMLGIQPAATAFITGVSAAHQFLPDDYHNKNQLNEEVAAGRYPDIISAAKNRYELLQHLGLRMPDRSLLENKENGEIITVIYEANGKNRKILN
jgi:hypothetical protein